MTKVYSYFDRPDRSLLSRHEPGESATVQAAALECDINNVVRRLLEGRDPGVPVNHGAYSDVSGVPEMKSNLDIIRRHESNYAELPPDVRQKYKTPLEYYNAQQQTLLKELQDQTSLDVSGPTDSESMSVHKKGARNETQTHESKNVQKDVQKSNRSSSGKQSDDA